MTITVAMDSAAVTLSEIHASLRKIVISSQPLEFNRFFLRKIRDRLHEACQHFEANGGAEEHEEIYLSFFDALAYVTDALRQTPPQRKLIEAALEQLDALHDLLTAMPGRAPKPGGYQKRGRAQFPRFPKAPK